MIHFNLKCFTLPNLVSNWKWLRKKCRFEHLENSNFSKIQMFQGLSGVCSVSYLKQWRKDAEVTTKEKNLHWIKLKALKEIENGQPKSLVAEKYDVPRNAISTWLLHAIKETIMAPFSSETINLKSKHRERMSKQRNM